jgi:hypothetical protein
VWKTFYKNMLDGTFNPGSYKKRQVGSGIAGMYAKKPYMIPVNPHLAAEKPKEIIGKQVSPVTAVEERAKEELRDEMRDNVPHVPVGSIKAENKQNSVIRQTARPRKHTARKSTVSQTRKRPADDKNLAANIFTSEKPTKKKI